MCFSLSFCVRRHSYVGSQSAAAPGVYRERRRSVRYARSSPVIEKDEEKIVPDFLDETRSEIIRRIEELRPLVEEAQRLEAAIGALDGMSVSETAAAPATASGRRRPGRPRGLRSTAVAIKPADSARSKPAAKRAPGRRKGSGKRAIEALAIVQEEPGISILELAGRMKIKQNYLYRVLPGLEAEGRVRKDGRGWHATATAAT